jgi:hypothetical protein
MTPELVALHPPLPASSVSNWLNFQGIHQRWDLSGDWKQIIDGYI